MRQTTQKQSREACFVRFSLAFSRRIDGAAALRSAIRFGINAQLLRSEAMKEGIHPDYHEITVMMTDGTSYKTRSTYGKAGDTLRLEIDSKSHPAWTGGQQRLVDSGGQLARFNKRFGGLGVKK
jgi:large subunit ribosomal protein L31